LLALCKERSNAGAYVYAQFELSDQLVGEREADGKLCEMTDSARVLSDDLVESAQRMWCNDFCKRAMATHVARVVGETGGSGGTATSAFAI
jgi:hypothetical protein